MVIWPEEQVNAVLKFGKTLQKLDLARRIGTRSSQRLGVLEEHYSYIDNEEDDE